MQKKQNGCHKIKHTHKSICGVSGYDFQRGTSASGNYIRCFERRKSLVWKCFSCYVSKLRITSDYLYPAEKIDCEVHWKYSLSFSKLPLTSIVRSVTKCFGSCHLLLTNH